MSISEFQDDETWKHAIDEMIAENTATAPTEPGLYRMPCGECYVDFFLAADGSERWLVPGDERSHTRDTVAIARHGEHPWERMHTLADAAAEIRRRATAEGTPVEVLVDELATIAEAEDAFEDDEIARVVRARPADGGEVPLADLARKFGVDLDEL